LVPVNKRSFGVDILKYAGNMDSKDETHYLDGKISKNRVVKKN
jgi:hypothetical protein